MDVFDVDGQAPLHKAVMFDQMESVQVLAMNGVDLNIKDTSGNTPLHVRQTHSLCAVMADVKIVLYHTDGGIWRERCLASTATGAVSQSKPAGTETSS